VPVVNSRDVAEAFERRHDNVLQAIDKLRWGLPEKSGDPWFRERHRHRPCLNQDPRNSAGQCTALGVSLDGALAPAGRSGGVGGEAFGLLFANLANTRSMLESASRDCTASSAAYIGEIRMFPEFIAIKAEKGFNAALREAAQRERQSALEWVRRRLREALKAEGVPLPEYKLETNAAAARRAA
jgi:hypothetical protein